MHLFTCVHTFALGHTIAQSQSYKPFMGWIAQLLGVPTTLMSDQMGVEGNLSQMSATTWQTLPRAEAGWQILPVVQEWP